MSEESSVDHDEEELISVSDVDDADTNVDDLEDVDKLIVTTHEESKLHQSL